MRPLYYALMGSNVMAFLLMGLDKWKAVRGAWRVSEKTLFLFPILGGAPGGTLGMYLFHHKTQHWYFAYGLPLLAIAQVLLVIYLKSKGKL